MQQKDFFERYEIDIANGRLGGGAFGTVYKAYDHLMDQWKAVKIAEVKYIDGKEFSLISEFNASKSIPLHKNVAHYESVHQFKMANGIFDYAIMQYYSEGNLKQLLSAKILQINEKFALVNGLLQGITFLHQNGVIHRDIKPSNILISIDTRNQYVPKIADFGLSKYVHDGDLSNITNSFGGGTLDYSSPEQLYGHPLKFNSDLWSLGVIVYEIFTGKKPFDISEKTGSPEAKRQLIYKKIIQAQIPEDIRLCPNPYDDVIRLCLVADPNQRVKKGDDLIQFLKNPTPIFIHSGNNNDDETILLPKQKDINTGIHPIQNIKNQVQGWINPSSNPAVETTEDLVLKAAEAARISGIEAQKEKDQIAAAEKVEAERKAAETARVAAIEAQKEKDRIAAEEKAKAEEKAAEAARIAAIEAQKERERVTAALKAEAERKAAEAARIAAIEAQQEKDRIEAAEKAETERKAAEAARIAAIEAQQEKDRIEAAEKAETERKAAEAARIAAIEAQKEKDRITAAEKIEAEHKAAEAARIAGIEAQQEKDRIEAAEKAETERKAAEAARIAAIEAQKEKDRIAAAEKIEAEHKAAEAARIAGIEAQKEKDRIAVAEKVEAERKAAEAAPIAAIEAQKEKDRIAAAEKAEAERKAVPSAKIATTVKSTVQHPEYEISTDEDKKKKRRLVLIFLCLVVAILSVISYYVFQPQQENIPTTGHEVSSSTPDSDVNTTNQTENIVATKAKDEYDKLKSMPKEKVTIALLENYIRTYPGNIYSDEIKKWIAKLTLDLTQNASEQQLYDQIISSESISIAQQYEKKFPKGKYIQEVKKLIADIQQKEEQQMWDAISATPTLAAIDAYLAAYPSGRYVSNAQQIKADLLKAKEIEKTKVDNTILTAINNQATNQAAPTKTEIPESNPVPATNSTQADDKKEDIEMPSVVKAMEKNFVKISGGKHTLGCDDKEKGCDPKNGTKTVQVRPFMISKFEMTQELYRSVTKENPSYYKDNLRNPVENISYKDVMEFIQKLNDTPGNPYQYRLPTEAEWEIAALAGTQSTFAGGEDFTVVAVTDDLGSSVVGQKKANQYGIFDMSGNIAEWCADDYGDFVSGKSSPKFKVVKGGSWMDKSSDAKIKKRNKADINRPFTFIGFRLVREIK